MKTVEQIVNELVEEGHKIFTINQHEIWYIDKKTGRLRVLYRPAL